MKNFLKYFLAIALFQIIVYKTYTGDIPGYNEYKYTQWDSSCCLSDHEEHIDRMSRGQKYIGAVTGAPGYNEYKYTQWDSSCSLSDHEEHIDRMSRGQKYIGAVTGAPGYSEYKYTHLDNSKITSSE